MKKIIATNSNCVLRGGAISFYPEKNIRLTTNENGIIVKDNSIIVTNNAPHTFNLDCYVGEEKYTYLYEVIDDIKDPSLQLINKYRSLKKNNKVETCYVMGKCVSKLIANDLIELIIDAYKNEVYVYIDSAYRSHETQKIVYEKYKDVAAEPGKSEHESGLAVDLMWGGRQTKELREKSMEYTWLLENCAKHGFILRYPKNKEKITGVTFEPWHFRWIGKKYSSEYYNKNFETLEEYVSTKLTR